MRQKIDPKDGPAMASGVLSVLYARLGDRDKAYDYFVKSYRPNSRPPFGVFSESANSNNPYFATGAGAMLPLYTVWRGTNRHGVEIQ
jgi:hypothetical protein